MLGMKGWDFLFARQAAVPENNLIEKDVIVSITYIGKMKIMSSNRRMRSILVALIIPLIILNDKQKIKNGKNLNAPSIYR